MNLDEIKGKRVFITGGLGFIGSNIAHKCQSLGAIVTIYDCLDPRSGGNMQNIQGIQDDIKIVLNDLRNFEGLCASILNQDIVFNCAAYTSHPGAMKEPLIDIDVNCKGVINLLEAARRFNPTVKIVHIGTSTQIGKMQLSEVDELHPEFPVDIYSANKSVSEKYVLIYGSAYGMRTTVVRLANTFGPRSNIKSPDFGFVNYFIGLALQGKDITIFGKGTQLRNFSYVEDSVNALLLTASSRKSDGQVFFAVGDHQISVAEIATCIVGHIGGKLKFVDWPKDREVIEVGDAIISNSKIKQWINWQPQFSIEAGLLGTRDYFNGCLKKYL
jgi:UDP-glucose 4-epimerase